MTSDQGASPSPGDGRGGAGLGPAGLAGLARPSFLPGGSGGASSELGAGSASDGGGSSPAAGGTPGGRPSGLLGGQGGGGGGAGDRGPGRPIVVACGPKGLTVQPGGYRLGRERFDKEPGLLAERLRLIDEATRSGDGGGAGEPSLRFLIEPGGQETYWAARRHLAFSGLDWPADFRVVEADRLRSFARGEGR